MALVDSIGLVAPLYNLLFVSIVYVLFIKLLSAKYKGPVYLFPWKGVFIIVNIFIVETLFTILRQNGIFDLPIFINGILEMIMIGIFIYVVLHQREYNKSFTLKKKPAPKLLQDKRKKISKRRALVKRK